MSIIKIYIFYNSLLYSQYSAVVLQENLFQVEPEEYFVVVIKCLLMVTWVPNCLCQLQSKSYQGNFRPKPSWQKCSYQLQFKAIFMVPKYIFRLSICGHSQQQAQLQKTPTRISKKLQKNFNKNWASEWG